MPELNNRPIVKYLDPKTGEYEYATVIDVGDLQLLNTQVKSDLVQAINSLFYDDRIGGGGELTPEDLEKLKNIQASIDSIKDGTFEIVEFGSINTYLNQEMNAKYEELVERLNESNREIYDATLIDIQAAVDAATLAYEQKVAEQNALLDGAEKTLTDTKLALEETAKKLETADINYKSVKQTVDELNAYIESEIKVIDMDNFNSMVSDYKTAVQQTEDRYGVEASKQTLSYLTGQVADAQAQIDVQAGEIELRAKTDQLQYIPAKKESNANPNLLFETIELLSSHWDREYGAMVTPNTFRYGKIGEFTSTNSKFTTVSDTLEIGETYTLSLYTNEQPLKKGPTDEKFAPTDDSFMPDDLTVIVDGKTVTMAIFEDLSSINGWCGVSGQFIATKENATITILSSGLEQTTHIGYISQPKLEKGLKVTPFISHVDDEIATVSTAFSLIKSQGDTILLQTQRVSQIGEENDALKETVAGIQIESNKITTAVSELEKKTDGEISRVEGKIETEANRIALDVSNKTTDEKLSALNMDTRNRIVNSDFELSEYVEKTKNWNYHGWSTIVSGIFTVLKLDNTNYLIADKTTTSSNLNNSVWMRSTPFEIQTGKKMNVQAEVFIASNPDNYQIIEIELFDDKNTLLSTVPINVSQYTSNVLRTVNVKNVPYNVFRVNFSTQIETEGVYKAQLKLGLRSGRGKVGFTKIMLNTSNMSDVDWSPAEEDNRIVQTKLESKIEILEDSITLMSEDERLDVLSGLLVQESGTFKISPQSILQEVTSAELGDSALVTKTFMNQTADGWKQGLVGKDGIIQAINASEEEYLIAFDKVRVDGLLEAKHFMGNALTLTDGFKIADKDGNAVLMANNDGQVVMNVSQLEINARPVATKDDLENRISEIELTPGPKGADGIPGKDGVGIKSTVITYGLSTSESTQPTTWNSAVPTLTKGKYLWTKTEWTYTDGSTEVGYTKSYIAKDGNTGKDGLPGKDGVGIKSTSIHYAKSTSGTSHSGVTWLTTVPSVPNGQYLWTRTTWTYDDDTTETGYSVAKMGDTGPQGPQGVQGLQGPEGKQGIQGTKGADGKSSYTHIAYATGDQGQSFSHSTFPQATHIGIYVSNNQNSSDNWRDYKWTLIKGADGAKGLPGAKGADGKTPYFHTAYANSADGKVDFSITNSDKKKYIGTATTYSDTNPSGADPTDPSKYKWVDMVGSVEVGGRNLLRDSGIPVSNSSYNIQTYTLTEKPIVGEEYTLTIKGKLGAGKSAFGAYNSGGNVSLKLLTNIGNGYYRATFDWSDTTTGGNKVNSTSVWIYAFPSSTVVNSSIEWIKLEKGNTATDWTPAPEDVQTNIDNIQVGGRNLALGTDVHISGNSYNKNKTYKYSDSFSVERAKREKYLTISCDVEITKAKAKVEGQEQNRVGVELSYYVGSTIKWVNAFYYPKVGETYSGRLTKTFDISDITSHRNTNIAAFLQSQAENMKVSNIKVEFGNKPTDWTPAPEDVQYNIDNIQVGGRNLLKGTSNSFETITSAGIWWNTFPEMIKIPLSQLGLSVGDEVVFSGILKATDTPAWLRLTMFWNETDYSVAKGSIIQAEKTGISEVKVTIPANTKYISFAFDFGSAGTTGTTISYKELKFERGNKRTDWTPAPEDVQSGIDSKADATDLNPINDSIEAMIESLKNKASTEALNKLREEYQKYTETSDENKKQVAENIEKLLGRESAITTNLGEMKASWTALTKQMEFGEEGLTIGNVTTGSYVLVDANQIAFYSNGSVTATIKDGNFEFIDGVITNSFRTLNLQMVQGNKANHVSFRLV